MRLVAHRGFADRYPENTLRAFREASTVADWVELDVRRCGSGELVVFHDEHLGRLTGASGLLAETSWDELREIEVLESGEGIPLLQDAFAVIPPAVGVNVELKDRGVAEDLLAVAAEFENDLLVSSFDAEALRETREVTATSTTTSDPSLAFITREASGAIETALDLDCGFVHLLLDACLGASSDFVTRAHEAGLEVNAWTVTTSEEADALQKAGVDGLIADSPDVV